LFTCLEREMRPRGVRVVLGESVDGDSVDDDGVDAAVVLAVVVSGEGSSSPPPTSTAAAAGFNNSVGLCGVEVAAKKNTFQHQFEPKIYKRFTMIWVSFGGCSSRCFPFLLLDQVPPSLGVGNGDVALFHSPEQLFASGGLRLRLLLLLLLLLFLLLLSLFPPALSV
jgi:hypothetical protein